MAPRRPILADERGTALFIAILGMLLLGVFALSAVVMANLETRLGLNQKEAQQALALAEGGLDHARSMLAAAVSAGNFDAFIADATTRQLGIASQTAGIPGVSGHYWVRVDNDCAATGGLTPSFVPVAIEDDPDATGPGTCLETSDKNETVVITAWAETDSGRGRAMVRAHMAIGNPWKHSCYDGDPNGELCIEDAAGGCNNNPCIDPSNPRHPNGPAMGPMPQPDQIQRLTGRFPAADNSNCAATTPEVDTDFTVAGTQGLPPEVVDLFPAGVVCVMQPYFTYALNTACPAATCGSTRLAFSAAPAGTCTNPATASQCLGTVFIGPQQVAGGGGATIPGPVGTAANPVVVYVVEDVQLGNDAVIHGTLVLHGNEVPGTNAAGRDLWLAGAVQVTTHPCPATLPGGAACGYPLAILAYNPNEPRNTATTAGQTMYLDMGNSNPSTLFSGIVYSGFQVDYNPITIDGSMMGWDTNINNTATRITYNSTYGNAAPPPGFDTVGSTEMIVSNPSTWIHCRTFSDQWAGPTACQ